MDRPLQPKQQKAPAAAIRLRLVVAGDLPTLFEIQSDPVSNDMAGTKPRTREVFFETWHRHFTDPGINARVIEVDGQHGPEIAGSIARFQADGLDAVGYWLARTHWGKGIASAALAMFLTEELRRPLHATTASSNAPSQHILQRCGFRRTGVRMGEETDRYIAREITDFVLE